jgi:cytochrome c oxidase assembly factor CtaG
MCDMTRLSKGIIAAATVFMTASRALAHEETPQNLHELAGAWEFEPGIVIPLLLSAWLYVQGVWRTWRASGAGRGIRTWEAGAFAAGWLTLVVALVSPLHPWGRALFSAHMAQHELLMLVAAPLLVLGRPMIALLRALPARWSNALARAGNNWTWQRIWRFLTNALIAWMLHAIVLWVWHAPPLMNLVIDNEWAHAAQHLCFLLSALLFWWAVIYGQRRALGYGMAVLYMFTTALHSGLLGVLLTFATSLWYPAYAQTTQAWGLSPLEDQQLGGLIMWIPAGVIYILAGLALLAAWIRESDARLLRRAASGIAAPLLIVAFLAVAGCDRPNVDVARSYTGGNEEMGKAKSSSLGCTACHIIPGVRGADARVGPPLNHIASRSYIGPGLANTPQNMIQFIQHGRQLDPKAAMPDLHLADQDARDIACYLYTLR